MPHYGEWSWLHRRSILNSEGYEYSPRPENIDRAIDSLTAEGGDVWLPRATFPLTAVVSVDIKRVKVHGAGLGTVITQPNGQNLAYFFDVSEEYFALEQVRLEGNRLNNVGTVGVRLQPTADYPYIKDNWIHAFNSWNLECRGSVFEILHNYLTESAASPLLFSAAADGFLAFNSIGGGLGPNGAVYISTGNYNTYLANKLFTCTNYGFYADTPANCGFIGNIIGGITVNHGIWLRSGVAEYGKYNRINNNLFYDIGGDGVRLDGAEVEYNEVMHNIFAGLGGRAVKEQSGGEDYNKIESNLLRNITGVPPIYKQGIHTTVKLNEGYNPVGNLTNPFDNVAHTFGVLEGGAAGPTVANQDYVCIGLDCSMLVTAGVAVSVTLEDPASTLIHTYGAVPVFLPRIPEGFIVNFGPFTGAPTVVVSGN